MSSSGKAVPFKPKVLTIEVTQHAIFLVVVDEMTNLSTELNEEIKSEMVAITNGVLNESQRALYVLSKAFRRASSRIWLVSLTPSIEALSRRSLHLIKKFYWRLAPKPYGDR